MDEQPKPTDREWIRSIITKSMLEHIPQEVFEKLIDNALTSITAKKPSRYSNDLTEPSDLEHAIYDAIKVYMANIITQTLDKNQTLKDEIMDMLVDAFNEIIHKQRDIIITQMINTIIYAFNTKNYSG